MNVTRYQREILLALTRLNKHVYAGTVPYEEIQRRRAVGRRAKKARRINRGTR